MTIADLERLEDFTLFVFLHMAFVDGSIHPTEKDTILEKMMELFPGAENADQLVRMETAYSKIGSERAEKMILEGLKNYKQIPSAQKTGIYAALFDIINANGKVDSEETQTLRALKSWLLPA